MADTPKQVTAGGTIVKCSHCGNEEFYTSSALLNTRGATFLGLEWANQSAEVNICAECGHLEWFVRKPKSG
ncbi:MAG: DNA-binding protein [Acidobacteria bacterium]|nr:DNA-binding protein [Acidobacteriota bacterium]